MKITLDLSNEMTESVEDFMSAAKTCINTEAAAKQGIDIDNFNMDAALKVLLVAGLEHFYGVSKRNAMRQMMKQTMEDGEDSGVGRMVIGPDGVEINGDLPPEILAVLSSIGASIQDAMGGNGDECDCPKCQMRRAHEVKGKMS